MKSTSPSLVAAALLMAVGSPSCVRKYNEEASAPSVFGGRQTSPGEYPATVDLWGPGDSSLKPQFLQSCTGVLIAPRVTLTAAHCFGVGMGADTINTFAGPWDDYRVRLERPAIDRASLIRWAKEAGQQIIDALQERAQTLAQMANDESLGSMFDPIIARIRGGGSLTDEDLAYVASSAIATKGIRIQKVRVMPDFDGDNYKHPDLALVFLANHDVEIKPAALAETPVVEDEKLVFAGYGLVDESDFREIYPPRTLKAASNFAQLAAMAKLDPAAEAPYFFAATWSPNPNRQGVRSLNPPYGLTCRGDSGGPVYRSKGNGHEVVGIVSRVAEFPSQDNCQPGVEYAKIYSRLDNPKVKEWISSTLEEWKKLP